MCVYGWGDDSYLKFEMNLKKIKAYYAFTVGTLQLFEISY